MNRKKASSCSFVNLLSTIFKAAGHNGCIDLKNYTVQGLITRLLSFTKRKVLRISRDRWNYQYNAGRWEGLHREDDRFREVIKMLHAFKAKPSILEIGCGDAILFRKLPAESYSAFTGMDISDVAITAAKQYEQENVCFDAGDMKTYEPAGKFDVIIFNESLYYAKEPVQVLKRYIPYLEEGGHFIVTAIDNKYTAGFWPPIEAAFGIVHTAEVRKDEFLWRIRELKPA